MSEKESIYFILGMASILLAYLAFSISWVISPALVFLFVFFLLYSVRHNLYGSKLLWISVILFALWFFNSILDLLFPFIVAFILAYLFDPFVKLLENRGVKRAYSSLLITIFGVGSVVIFILIYSPLMVDQVTNISIFIQNLPIEKIYLLIPEDILESIGINIYEFKNTIVNLLYSRLDSIASFSGKTFSSILKNVSGAFSIFIGILIIPILSLYFLNDFPNIKKTLASIVPKKHMGIYNEFIVLASNILRQYFRGQIIVVTILALTYSTIFYFIGMPYSLTLGLTYGIMAFIPYIGGILSLLATGIISLLTDTPGPLFLYSLIAYVIVHSIENFVLVPRLVGKKVHLNPIILFLSIFIFGRFLGFFGILLAIPLSAFLVAIINKYYIEPNTSPKK